MTGCPSDTPTPPDDKPRNCSYPAGSRNFNWRLDTVAWFPSTVGGVWAFSDSDAYLMGYIFNEPSNPNRTLYAGLRWDGNSWQTNIYGTYGFDNASGTWGDIAIDPRNDVTGDDHFLVAVGFWGDPGIKAGIAEFDNRIKKWKSYQFQTGGQLRGAWTDGKGFFIATGDSGMVYTKDGYQAEWLYHKVPTDFNLFRVQGVSKTEVYLLGDKAVPGKHYQQIWRLLNDQYLKVYDNFDTTGTPIQFPEPVDDINGIAVSRCSISDSLYLLTVGDESYEFAAQGYSFVFSKTNLATRGLPLSLLNIPASNISLISPNDYWISSAWYYAYHWNGADFQKIEPLATLPYGQPVGLTTRVQQSNTGKTWLVLEMDSQVYAVIQGTK